MFVFLKKPAKLIKLLTNSFHEMFDSFALKPFLLKEIDRNGLMLRPQAFTKLLSFLSSDQEDANKIRLTLSSLISIIKSLSSENILTESIIDEAMKLFNKQSANLGMMAAVNEKIQKSLILLNLSANNNLLGNDKSIFGNADEKQKMIENRFNLIRSSLSKDDKLFFKENIISEIGSLIGTQGKKFLLGIIFEQEKDVFYLQDAFSKVRLDLATAFSEKGFIIPGNIVIAEGILNGDAFKVEKVHLPSEENKNNSNTNNTNGMELYREKTISVFGKLIELEQESSDSKKKKQFFMNLNKQLLLGFVDLSHLTERENLGVIFMADFVFNSETFEKFETTLKAAEELKIGVFVLIGEFFNNEIKDEKESEKMNINIENFNKIIEKYSNITKKCAWLFVPGVYDLGLNLLPRKGLPAHIFEKMTKNLPRAINASNPCRLSIMGTDFLITKNEVLKDLRRNCIVQYDEAISFEYHMIETILSQKHLSPISCFTRPVIWNLDENLMIKLKPDFIIFADSFCKQFEIIGKDKLKVMNPGNFGKNGVYGVVYAEKKIIQLY